MSSTWSICRRTLDGGRREVTTRERDALGDRVASSAYGYRQTKDVLHGAKKRAQSGAEPSGRQGS